MVVGISKGERKSQFNLAYLIASHKDQNTFPQVRRREVGVRGKNVSVDLRVVSDESSTHHTGSPSDHAVREKDTSQSS